jgi:serine protease Do
MGLSSSVTMGVVSAVARQLAPEDPMIYIQTDAPINPGNSGGALVDTEGRLVGINTMILSQSGGSEGIGFAAPSNIVRNVVTQIQRTGRVRRGEIGVHAQTVTPLLAEALKLSGEAGVVLSDVSPGSPAERAGLKVGDVIVALDGKPMENGRQFRINVYTRGAGQQVVLDVRRGERSLQVRVPVIERPTGPGRLTDVVGVHKSVPELGISVLDLTPTVAEILPDVRNKAGAVVFQVLPTAPYSQQGRLLPGDAIYSLNGRAVANGEELRIAAAALAANAAAVLHLEREGVLMYVSFRIER